MSVNLLGSIAAGIAVFLVLRRYSSVPIATSALLSLMATGYLASCPGLSLFPSWKILHYWGSSLESILSGRVYTLLTSMFLHAGIIHLAFNSYALYFLGPMSEGALGPKKTISIFLTSGVMGSLGSALLNPSAVSVGASGGILGLLGVAIVLEKARFGSVSPTSIVVALLAVGGGFLEGVDVVAHASGFVVGLLMGWLFLSSSEYAYEAR